MNKIKLVILCLLVMQGLVYAQNPADYLILQTIGQYHSSGKGRCGEGSGIIGGADHFDEDHNVTTCSTGYYFMQQDLAVSIKVEQHTGGDSDKWLLHEAEDGYRRSSDLNATYSAPNPIRIINNNKIWFQWGAYTWLRNNIVVRIEFTDLQGTKPEPIEVVQAYLSKFPSTITLTNDEAKGNAHNVQWIKDEMERRLWLCDKWGMQLQLGKVSQTDMLNALVENMTIFLNYRQKYYGVSKTEEEINLLTTYLRANDGTSIKAKLTEYKTWWTANKSKSISL